MVDQHGQPFQAKGWYQVNQLKLLNEKSLRVWDLSGRFVLNWSKRSLCKTKLCFFEEDFKKTKIRKIEN